MNQEKDMFIRNWEREFQTTMKILRGYPENKLDLVPAEKCRSARDLAWIFSIEENVLIDGAISGNVNFGNMKPSPQTLKEIIDHYEQSHSANVNKVKNMSDEEWHGKMDFFTGPQQMGKVRRADVLWMGLQDAIHHRGQFSIYLRLAGAKVPSIYGPSADEPWM